MNQTSPAPTTTPLSSGTDISALVTNAHLILIAVLAVLVIVGIVYGARLKSRRVDAERRVVEHAQEAGIEPAPVSVSAPVSAPAPTDDIAEPPPAPASTGDAAAGAVTQLKGLGPRVAARLGEIGVTTVGQLAGLDDDGARALDARMGPFKGRLERDRWIEQARFLAAGDTKGFEAVFGRL